MKNVNISLAGIAVISFLILLGLVSPKGLASNIPEEPPLAEVEFVLLSKNKPYEPVVGSAISSSGNRAVYVSGRSGLNSVSAICVVNTDGTGHHILFEDGKVPDPGRPEIKLCRYDSQPAISGDGNTIAFTAGTYGKTKYLLIYNFKGIKWEGPKIVPFKNIVPKGYDLAGVDFPSISFKGDVIVLMVTLKRDNYFPTLVTRTNKHGATPVVLTRINTQYMPASAPLVSGNGKIIIFGARRHNQGNSPYVVYIMDSTGGNLRNINPQGTISGIYGPGDYQISYDGTKVGLGCMDEGNPENRQYRVINFGTGHHMTIKTYQGTSVYSNYPSFCCPMMSRDGNRVFYLRPVADYEYSEFFVKGVNSGKEVTFLSRKTEYLPWDSYTYIARGRRVTSWDRGTYIDSSGEKILIIKGTERWDKSELFLVRLKSSKRAVIGPPISREEETSPPIITKPSKEIVNGDFAHGLKGWSKESYGYRSVPGSQARIIGPDFSDGHLRLGVYGGTHTVYQEISIHDLNVNLTARFRVKQWSTFGGRHGGWAAIGLSYYGEGNNLLGSVYFYVNPFKNHQNRAGVYWYKIGEALPVPTDWYDVDVNIKEAAENLLSIRPGDISKTKISAITFGTHEDRTYTIAEFDDFKLTYQTHVQKFKSSSQEEILFYDDFERDELGSHWFVQSGRWIIENGKLKAIGKNGVLWLTLDMPDDIAVDIEVQGPYDLNIGIGGDGKINSGYVLDFGGWWNSNTALTEADRIVVENKAWRIKDTQRTYRLRIERKGELINCFIDGRKVLTYDRAKLKAKSGFNRISLRNWGFPITFDNIKVYSFTYRSSTTIDISGQWYTDFGRLVITQDAQRINGEYTHDNGRIRGTIMNNVLTGIWSESPSYAPPKDAGDFEFYFSRDGKSFKGYWRYGHGENRWDGEWKGSKIE